MSYKIKDMFRLCLIFILIIFLSGCSNAITLPYKRFYPKYPRFGIIPNCNTLGNSLSDEAVYVFDVGNIDGVLGRYYNYYRFWDNGRVLFGGASNISAETIDDFTINNTNNTVSSIGYYNNYNGYLKIELFAYNSGKYKRDYMLITARIKPDGILEEQSNIGGLIRTESFFFKKIPLEGMRKQPDW